MARSNFWQFARPAGLDALAPRGVSTAELLVTMGVLAILVGISMTALIGARKSRAQAQCAANLHAIGIAFTNYTTDYQDSYPVPNPSAQWEDLLRDWVPRSAFRCAADSELYAALGSSYDWRDTGNSKTTLAGKLATQVNHTDISLAFDALPSWHAKGKVQVLKVDISVGLMDQADFFKDLQRSPTAP